MLLVEIALERPQRWDQPFGDSMRDEDVDQLLNLRPFSDMDPATFPSALPLRGILKNDTRINYYPDGAIVVREGDYGSSAYLVLRGKVRAILATLDPALLGRQKGEKRGFLKSLVKMWTSPRLPETRQHIRPVPGLKTEEDNQPEDLTQVHVFLQDVPRMLDETRTVSLMPGDIFGEVAALSRTPRSATVIADGDAWLLEIRWQGLRDLMGRTLSLRNHIEQLYRENSLRDHLRETPLLARLPDEELEKITAATQFETYGNFEWDAQIDPARRMLPEAIISEPLIAEEGSTNDGILLVRSGFARLSQHFGHGHRTIAYLGKGQIYGLAESIQTARDGEPVMMTNSLRALGYVDVLRIPQAALVEHVFPHFSREELGQIAANYAAYSQQNSEPGLRNAASQIETPMLEFLVERRLMNGIQAMLIDLDRCTRCDDCVRACAATHDNNPRFVRTGQRHGPYMVAHACMHCTDPVCMIGCPTGAIGRDTFSGVVRINDLTCVGCSTCANSCPYNNIQMVEVRDPSGAIAVDRATRQPLQKATKCDLCTDQLGGPACQRACPHDALVRMDLGNLGELSAWVNR